MATVPNPVTIDEYLATSYSPDREYVDGMILERNMGKGRHSFAQAKLILTLSQQLGSRAIVLPEQRAHVSPERVRIPDVCVVEQLEEVTTQPPLLCVEILSPDDHWKRVLAAISDYQLMGVPYVWWSIPTLSGPGFSKSISPRGRPSTANSPLRRSASR
jgi:Uma2 family endonuclease